ncbi:MAG: carboxypeptidase regulatory-like domain-containing protein [Bacteroidaceae bacterium]|nr:carboxypeptidase regulatory-like domain-containing protein [Bacteroidaceae bacterium]
MKHMKLWSMLLAMVAMTVSFGSCSNEDEEAVTTGSIVGLVSDFANANTPVAGATVTLVQQGEVKVTGSDGRYEFSNLRPGSYTVAVSANNFQSNTQMAYVTAGNVSHCDFQMQRSSQNVEITPMSLTFGKNISQLSFYIVNNTNTLLTYSFSNVPDYLQISPASGTVAAKGRQAILASIPNRSSVSVSGTQTIIVNVGSDSYALTLTMTNSTVTPPEDQGGQGGEQGGEQGGGGQQGGSTSDVTRGLLAYYNFDNGTANNAAGTQNNGVINGAAQFIDDTPNGKGKALFLDQEQYVNVARNPLNGKDSYTISMWVKDFGTGFLYSNYNTKWYNGSGSVCLYIHSDGTLGLLDSWYKFNYNILSMQSSGWHMLTVVATGSTFELYVDGNIYDSINDSWTLNGNKMQIGGRGDIESRAWADPFKVDNVRIYGVPLTEEEVSQLYNYEKK